MVAKIKGNKNPYFDVYTVPYYKTEITFTPVQNILQLLDDIENDPLVLAKLASKELPSSIGKLLPRSRSDIQTKCSCPDYENPCKHIAGLYLKLAEKMDYDPFLLLALRGVSEDLLSARLQVLMPELSQQRTPALLSSKQYSKQIKWREFWGTTQKIKEPETLSTIPCLLIKKAGINPPFWHKNKPFLMVMEGLYKTIRRYWD